MTVKLVNLTQHPTVWRYVEFALVCCLCRDVRDTTRESNLYYSKPSPFYVSITSMLKHAVFDLCAVIYGRKTCEFF